MSVREWIVGFAFMLAAVPLAAAEGEDSKPFEEVGVIVDVQSFFTVASAVATAGETGDQAGAVQEQAQPGELSLVTEEGVFAFLETPQNAEQLKATEPRSVVQARGKLLERGALLHVDKLELVTTVPLIDFARFREDQGKQVSLKGVNKCQCGLGVADLPHSCELGHLHHLEADDGKIYHYLPTVSGQEAFLGKGSHFKPVEVAARVLPGQYLLIENIEVK